MRTITTTTNVFEITELKGSALENAINKIQTRQTENAVEHNTEEFMESARNFAEKFGFTITNWSVGFFDYNNFLTVDSDQYFELTNEDKNDLVKLMNETYKEETDGQCSLTGVYTDCYFFDYFKEKKGTSYNTFHKDIPAAMQAALKQFVSDQEQDLTNDEYAKQYANDMEMEFYEDGSIFH